MTPRPRYPVLLFGLFAIAAALTGCGPTTGAPDGVVRIAAAADLQYALADLQSDFAATNPDIELKTTYGSSGTFYQQLRNGAPFDVYLSADIDHPQRLVAEGLAAESDLFDYAVGRLVVWAPDDSAVDPALGVVAMADPAASRAAIANPEHAPYGQAAVAAMTSAGVYEAARDRLVVGENVAQAAEFVQSGNADVGLIALSLALAPPMLAAGAFTEVPLADYPPLRQGGVILASAADPEAARTFRDYLLSPAGRATLKAYGFYLPGA